MIPTKLRLRNFMCYRDDVPPLLLEGLHVACLCGENGAGKSAILDAITWALWGEVSRVKAEEDLIHLGKDEMEVELEFLAQGNLYRVVRKRERGARGRAGKGLLELHLHGGEEFLAITANTSRETQIKIDQLLKMDFQTFVHSAFLVQGRSDAFTLKSPDKRKEVLADILNLAYYDGLEERAKEGVRRTRETRRALEMAIQEIERELGRRNEYQNKVIEVQASLELRQRDLQALEAEVQLLRSERQALEHKQALAAGLRQKVSQRDIDIARLRQRQDAALKSIAEFEKVIADAQAITTAHEALERAAAGRAALDNKAGVYMELMQKRATQEQAIQRAMASLERDLGLAKARVNDLRVRAEALPRLEAERAQVEIGIKALSDVESAASARRAELPGLAAQAASLKTVNEQRRQETKEIKQRMEQLRSGNGTCPVCGTALGQDRCQNVLEEYQARGKEAADAYRHDEKEIARLTREQTRLEEELAKSERRLRTEQSALHGRAGQLRHALLDAASAKEELPVVEASLAEVARRVAEGDCAHQERQALAGVVASLQGLGYDREAHDRVRAEHEALRSTEASFRLLEDARRRFPQERERLEETRKELADREREAADERAQLQALVKETADLPQLARRLQSQEQALEVCRGQVDRLRQDLGAARQDLTRLEVQEAAREEKRKDLAQAVDEGGAFEELALAFGRRGIQALIIDSVVPEIEEEANRLLGRMTDNRMSLKLETQEPLKTKDGLKETLGIKVSDDLGTRSYETYSGGEAFRVNVSLRIALSRLLAKRAGAPLPTLFIDEGFGTQDTAGRDKVVEAIRAIQDDFQLILIITHIDEMKEQFPVRIEVRKEAAGSAFWVT